MRGFSRSRRAQRASAGPRRRRLRDSRSSARRTGGLGGFDAACPRAGRRVRWARADDDAVRGARRRARRDADRPGRDVQLRLLEARRDVRSCGAAGRPTSLPGDREAGRALPARDGHRDRSGGAAGHDGRRRPRGRRARRRARRRLRPGRHAGPRRGGQRVLLVRRRRAAGGAAAGVLVRARARRRLRGAVQVPAGAARPRCCCTTC